MSYNHWLGKLANLNVANTEARGRAPHKPLMLLTVIDLIESGVVPDGWVKYDVRLVSRFRDYWELVRERQQNAPDIPMPFHALGGDKVWARFNADGQPSLAKATTRLCHLDPDLFACLQDGDFRRRARETLVSIYFTPHEQVMLCARLGLQVPDTAAITALKEDAAEYKASQKKGRDSRFKSDVLGGYYFTCALTGYRLDTEQSDQIGRILDGRATTARRVRNAMTRNPNQTTSIVQAAHIHQHAISGNDDPRNGLALTPDAHWMFDAGLWSAMPKGDDFLIRVAKNRFTESAPHGHALSALDGTLLHFHNHSRLRPATEHLTWHRTKHRL
jgi:putative restriction endonuclease